MMESFLIISTFILIEIHYKVMINDIIFICFLREEYDRGIFNKTLYSFSIFKMPRIVVLKIMLCI